MPFVGVRCYKCGDALPPNFRNRAHQGQFSVVVVYYAICSYNEEVTESVEASLAVGADFQHHACAVGANVRGAHTTTKKIRKTAQYIRHRTETNRKRYICWRCTKKSIDENDPGSDRINREIRDIMHDHNILPRPDQRPPWWYFWRARSDGL